MLYTHEEHYLESIVCTTHWEHDSPYYTCLILQETPWAYHECHIATCSSCGRDHLEDLRRHFMARFLDGVAWAILGGHTISAQGQRQPHMYHKWREKHLGNRRPNSPFSPNTLHIPGVEISIWMIAWMRGSSLGTKFSHACHHSYLEEAIAQREGFHLHLLSFHDVHHSGFHTWEEALADRFVVGYFEQWWRLLMRAQEKRGRNFFLSMQLLEEKQHVGGEDCNVPNF